MRCKGNQFKNKYVLIEAIHKAKNEEKRAKELGAQVEAKKSKKKGLESVPQAQPVKAAETKKVAPEAKKSE